MADKLVTLVIISGAGLLAYFTGMLCWTKIPQLCPSGGGNYIPGISDVTHQIPYPEGGRLAQVRAMRQQEGGYGDYDFESNQANLTIA